VVEAGKGLLALLVCLAPAMARSELALKDAAYLGISGGWVACSNDDMRSLVPGAIVPEQWGSLGMLKLGFLSESGFWIEAAYRQGPSRQFTEASSKGVYSFTESSFSIEPGIRAALAGRAMLGFGLALGLSSDSFAYHSPQINAAYSGSNFSLSPEARLSLAFNLIGVDLDFGFHFSQSGAMKDEVGAPLVITSPASGEAATWRMDNSGYFLRLGIVYYFSAPIHDASRKKERA
jgi:hypothetical protein